MSIIHTPTIIPITIPVILVIVQVSIIVVVVVVVGVLILFGDNSVECSLGQMGDPQSRGNERFEFLQLARRQLLHRGQRQRP